MTKFLADPCIQLNLQINMQEASGIVRPVRVPERTKRPNSPLDSPQTREREATAQQTHHHLYLHSTPP